MKNILLIFIFVFINTAIYPQRQVNLDPYDFLENIKQKIINVDGSGIYVDLNTNSYIQPRTYYSEKEEIFVEFEYQIYEGNFINKNTLEYLFIIKLPEGIYIEFFPHVASYGNTTMVYIFDSLYNQISDVSFRNISTKLIDIIDIDNDGIDEVFMKSYYVFNCGVFMTSLSIFSINFRDSKLDRITELDAERCGISGDNITIKSDYLIESGKLVLNSKLDYYICMGTDEDGNNDNRFYKTEYRQDIFEFKNGKFYHIKDKNNVDWNDERLVY